MSSTQEKALFHLTGTSSLSDCSVDSLQAITQSHPYFSPAQFLLASKLRLENQADAGTQIGKTTLHFTNPSWLRYQLSTITPKTTVETFTSDPPFLQSPPPVEKLETNPTAPIELPDEPELHSSDTPVPDKLSNLVSEQLAAFKKPVEADAKLDIDAGPQRLHMIDYFASQGIKADLNSMPQDKLTAQLRKFTDWLKEMKQTPEPEPNEDLEQAVMLIAQNSNETREVVTETMAEVLFKQGQVEKAIQLYIKLSFLNPEKSAYFATKIQHLKGI